MPSPANAAIAWRNLADGGTVTASSFIADGPPSTVQNVHVARKWRSNGNSGAEYLLVDLGSVQSIDTVAVMGVTLPANGTARVRASTTNVSATAALVYDGPVIAAAVDPAFGMLVVAMPAPVSARYVRIDLTHPSTAYVEAGRLFIGARYQFTFNYGPGWTYGYADPSERSKSLGGQTVIRTRTPYRVASLSFEAVTEAERNAVVLEVDRIAGVRSDVLLILRSDSPNLARDTIWGLLADLDPVGQPTLVWADGQPLFQKSYRIEERL